MSDLMRRTKADLVAEVERLTALVAQMPQPTKRDFDKEARAIDRCVDALTPLKPERGSYSYGQETPGQIERVLRYLAGRFGVSLIEVAWRDCDREHLDGSTTWTGTTS